MDKTDFKISEIESDDKILVTNFITDSGGSSISVSKGKVHKSQEGSDAKGASERALN